MIRIRPRPRDSHPASSAWRSTRLTVARDVPARLARSSWVSGISVSPGVWGVPEELPGETARRLRDFFLAG